MPVEDEPVILDKESMEDAAAVLRPRSALRTALAGLIGNVLEWFDFAVYSYFASDIGSQFFPHEESSGPEIGEFGI